MEGLVALEGSVLLWIQDCLRADWLSPFVVTYTKLGNLGFIWILLSLTLLCFRKTRRAGVAGLLGLMFSLILNNMILKNLFARTRPYEVIDGLILMTGKASDFSFPSGHAGSSFAAATAIVCSLKGCRWRWIVLAMAVLMAFSRLYIGIHYPSDVICGALTGALCGAAAAWLIRWLVQKQQARA
ncbi:MAG: phosphatase PAP2 family protein [Lachnospiraceae bacterium]|uniref:phosphatase PAP2 family protein n=1 Tax=Parablautia sp. Marseille-Q6255 TaxID=3039593 RepID=UPI0024BC67D6|nr:phosphatase PAP2 family protein [Parablautia sp. Marseille-Q6255]